MEKVGPVGWIVFDHPERRNALTASMMRQVLATLSDASKDDGIRVVVLRGAGDRAFISGADISAFGSASGVDRGPSPRQVMKAVTGLDKPVIAALKGWCLGAGVLVALSADLRIAGDDIRIGIPAAKLGIAYPKEGVEQVVGLAGPGAAAEMLMLGEPFDADGALGRGLVSRVVAAADVFEEAQQMGEALAVNAPLAMKATKRTIASVRNPGDEAAAEVADLAIAACYRSEDFQEGQQAFAEKRRPHFQGR